MSNIAWAIIGQCGHLLTFASVFLSDVTYHCQECHTWESYSPHRPGEVYVWHPIQPGTWRKAGVK